MNHFFILGIINIALLTGVTADIPQKAPLNRYTALWSQSPFTSKPAVTSSAPANNPINDFTLLGIAPVPGGYRITIASKKNRDQKITLEPGVKSEFKVISVDRNPETPLGTTVLLSSGKMQGVVKFEPSEVILKTTQVKDKAQPTPSPAVVPTQNQHEQPRPRVMVIEKSETNQKQPNNHSMESQKTK